MQAAANLLTNAAVGQVVLSLSCWLESSLAKCPRRAAPIRHHRAVYVESYSVCICGNLASKCGLIVR